MTALTRGRLTVPAYRAYWGDNTHDYCPDCGTNRYTIPIFPPNPSLPVFLPHSWPDSQPSFLASVRHQRNSFLLPLHACMCACPLYTHTHTHTYAHINQGYFRITPGKCRCHGNQFIDGSSNGGICTGRLLMQSMFGWPVERPASVVMENPV